MSTIATSSKVENLRPALPVPESTKVIFGRESKRTTSNDLTVTPEEIQWMLAKRDILSDAASYTPQQLEKDFGSSECEKILEAFDATFKGDSEKQNIVLPLLKWPGIGTRWRSFLSWIAKEQQVSIGGTDGDKTKIRTEIFTRYANHLGRITSYRALALDSSAFNRIIEKENCIFPTGQLRLPDDASPEQLQKSLYNIVDEHGICKVLVARLFIAHLQKMIGIDPSVSLHDDWQTTCIISSGYFSSRGQQEAKKVYLFEVSVPAILPCAWTLAEVGSFGEHFLGNRYRDHPAWFHFDSPAGGCWFDGTIQRTERYTFYGIPFLKEHALQRIYCFENIEEIGKAVQPFVNQQEKLHSRFPEGEAGPRMFQ